MWSGRRRLRTKTAKCAASKFLNRKPKDDAPVCAKPSQPYGKPCRNSRRELSSDMKMSQPKSFLSESELASPNSSRCSQISTAQRFPDLPKRHAVFQVSSLVAWDADVDVALTAPTAVSWSPGSLYCPSDSAPMFNTSVGGITITFSNVDYSRRFFAVGDGMCDDVHVAIAKHAFTRNITQSNVVTALIRFSLQSMCS